MTRVLPRDWGLARLLRFLAGLALVALAFTVPAFADSPAAPTPAVSAVSVAVPAEAPGENPVRQPLAPVASATALVLAAAAFPHRTAALTGRIPLVRAGRAPPLA